LNERLVKLVRLGVLEKVSYPQMSPRVEYHFTPFGQSLHAVLDAIEALERTWK
jgi:DNA-binding HxlR family transcriptional regulator